MTRYFLLHPVDAFVGAGARRVACGEPIELFEVDPDKTFLKHHFTPDEIEGNEIVYIRSADGRRCTYIYDPKDFQNGPFRPFCYEVWLQDHI